MHEPYRTLLGHFRHEIGHYYWDHRPRLRRGSPGELPRRLRRRARRLRTRRSSTITANGPPADWQSSFVSTYATAHPWEDFAETWAHYLHIVDTLETARSFGIKVRPRIKIGHELEAQVDFDPHRRTTSTS